MLVCESYNQNSAALTGTMDRSGAGSPESTELFLLPSATSRLITSTLEQQSFSQSFRPGVILLDLINPFWLVVIVSVFCVTYE